MRSNNENRWWDIFVNQGSPKGEDRCPVLPVNEGRAWQKGLVNLYCPCNSTAFADECQMGLT